MTASIPNNSLPQDAYHVDRWSFGNCFPCKARRGKSWEEFHVGNAGKNLEAARGWLLDPIRLFEERFAIIGGRMTAREIFHKVFEKDRRQHSGAYKQGFLHALRYQLYEQEELSNLYQPGTPGHEAFVLGAMAGNIVATDYKLKIWKEEMDAEVEA